MSDGLRRTDDLRVVLEDGPNRATVKLVYEAVASASKENRAYSKGIEQSLSRLENLPVLAAQLVTRMEDIARRTGNLEEAIGALHDIPSRVKALEDADRSGREYRRVHLPTLALSVVGIALSVLGLANVH